MAALSTSGVLRNFTAADFTAFNVPKPPAASGGNLAPPAPAPAPPPDAADVPDAATTAEVTATEAKPKAPRKPRATPSS